MTRRLRGGSNVSIAIWICDGVALAGAAGTGEGPAAAGGALRGAWIVIGDAVEMAIRGAVQETLAVVWILVNTSGSSDAAAARAVPVQASGELLRECLQEPATC